MYLGNRIFGIVYVYLIGMLFLSACAEGERYINNEEESIVALEEVPNSETIYQENIAETKVQKKIYQIVQELILNQDASAFNQGMMDLGATICKPVHPLCSRCPIQKEC